MFKRWVMLRIAKVIEQAYNDPQYMVKYQFICPVIYFRSAGLWSWLTRRWIMEQLDGANTLYQYLQQYTAPRAVSQFLHEGASIDEIISHPSYKSLKDYFINNQEVVHKAFWCLVVGYIRHGEYNPIRNISYTDIIHAIQLVRRHKKG